MHLDALVLHTLDYRDSSKILYLYTETGHYSVLAHGVKKLNSVNRFLSQNGTVIRCIINEQKELPALRDGELVEEFEVIKQDIIAYTYMNHMMELVRHTISDDLDHPKMYRFLIKVFTQMNNGVDSELLSFLFELKLLYFLGNGLHLRSCTMCQETNDLVFHVSSGGLVCRQHLHPTDVVYDATIYDQITQLYYLDIDTEQLPIVTPNDRVILRHILDLLFDEFVSYNSKSRAILNQMKKY